MPATLTCTLGHEWSPDWSKTQDGPGGTICPHCGKPALGDTLNVPARPAAPEAIPETIAEHNSPTRPLAPESVTEVTPASALFETLVPPPESVIAPVTLAPAPPKPTSPAPAGLPPLPASSAGETVPRQAVPPPSVGNVPGYEILSILGRGGMGVVYKARQIKANRLVALKMILAGGHASGEQRARFRIEAEAIARLQHPNIVQVYDVGEHDDRPYFSLEYLEGGSLSDQLDGTPWPARQAAELVETLARAMHHAHERGIVHRDLKPANVLLAACGLAGEEPPSRKRQETAVPKITDFGLAKQMDAEVGQTHSGDVLGTPSYMAPEQAEGKVTAIGPATDVYALGAILYELVTGRPPFKGTSVLDTLEQVRIQEPVAPRQLQLQAPRDLETICLKCLAKIPDRRYASALDLAEDLRRFRDGEPIRARPVGNTERVYRWCRRNPRVAGLLTTLVVVTLTGVISVTALWARAETQRDRAERNLHGALSAVDHYFTNVSENRLLNEPGAEGLRRDLLVAARDYYDQFVRDNEDSPELKGELGKSLFRLGQIFEKIDDRAEGIQYHKRALAIFQPVARKGPNPKAARADLAATHHHLGRLYRLTSQTDLSREHYEAALALWEDLPDRRAELARTRMGLGNLSQDRGHFEEAENWYAKALETRQALVKENPRNVEYLRDLAVNHDNLATVFGQRGQPAKADQQAEQAEKYLRRLVKENPAVISYKDDLARHLFDVGERLARRPEAAKARAAYQDAAGIWRDLGRDHPLVALHQANLAAAYHNEADVRSGVGEHDEAEKLYVQAMRIKEQLSKKYPDDPDHQFRLALSQRRMGDIQRNQDRPDRAAEEYKKASEVLERLVKEHKDIVVYQSERVALLTELGQLAQRKKENEEAERHYRQGLAICDDLLKAGKKTPELVLASALCRGNLANLDREKKQLAESVKGYETAIADLEQLIEQKYQDARVTTGLREASWGMALALEASGEPVRAAPHWERAIALSDPKQRRPIVYDRAVWRLRRASARGAATGKALAGYSQAIHELEGLLREGHRPEETTLTLRNAFRVRAQLLTQLGEYAESLRAWDRVVELTEEKQQGWFKLYRLDTLARSGVHAQATREAEVLLPALGEGAPAGVAGVFAVAAGAARRDEGVNEAERTRLANEYSRRALVLLGEAEKNGWFKQAANLKRLQQDKALDPLREREDFQMLLKRVGG